MMNTNEILAALIAERDKLTAAIAALTGPAKHIGRPPKNASMNGATAHAPAKKTTRVFTAAQRKKQAAAMKRYWAAKKRAES
jgi:hypothetical protein